MGTPGPMIEGIRLEEDHRIVRGDAAHLLGVGGVILTHANNLAGQDRRQQAHVGQQPAASGERRFAERMLGDLPAQGLTVTALDCHEGDTVRACNSTKTHCLSVVAVRKRVGRGGTHGVMISQ